MVKTGKPADLSAERARPPKTAGVAITREATLGLWGATGVGLGAIVGGGILALAGVAFATRVSISIIETLRYPSFAPKNAIACRTSQHLDLYL